MTKRWIIALLALGVAVGTAVPPYATHSNEGDVNGDAVTDVLDVQSAIHAVTHQRDDGEMDVNKDGRVDVLDFHLVLARATYAPSSTEPPPTKPKPSGTIPLVQDAPPGLQLPKRPVQVLVPEEDTEASERDGLTHFVATAPETERYLFRLTPHAPPAA